VNQPKKSSFYLPRPLVGRVHFDDNAPVNPPAPPAAPPVAPTVAPPQNQPAPVTPAPQGQKISDAAFTRLMDGLLNDPERREAAEKLLAGEKLQSNHERIAQLEKTIADERLERVRDQVVRKYSLTEDEAKGLANISDPAKLDEQGQWIKSIKDNARKAAEESKPGAANGHRLPPYPGEQAAGGLNPQQWLEQQFVSAVERGDYEPS
jgi:predicted nucleotidyltransferase